jgi:hypothetical protein
MLSATDTNEVKPANAAAMPAQDTASDAKIIAFDKANFVKVTNEQLDFLTRDERKDYLAKAGIDENTPDNYRIAFYTDKNQTVVLKGTADKEGHVTFTDSKVVSIDGAVTLDKMLLAINEKDFKLKKLPKEIAVNGAEKHVDGKSEDATAHFEFNLSADDKKKLTADVTLLAMAEKAVTGGVAIASAEGSNANLPNLKAMGVARSA